MATTLQPTTGITYADFLRMPRTTQPHEILDGELHMAPAPSSEHQWLLASVFRSLDQHTRALGLGIVLMAPLDVIIRKEPKLRTRQPDILYINPEHTGITGRRELQQKPALDVALDLVVELLSPDERRRELAGKLDDYAELGVIEVWLVSPEAETVEVLTLVEGQYARADIFGRGDTVASTVLPDLALAVDTIFED